MEIRPCPICGNNEKETLEVKHHIQGIPRIWCKTCNCAYIGSPEYKKPVYDLSYNLHFYRPGDIRKAFFFAMKVIPFLEQRFPAPRLLEAGVGNGLFLALLQMEGLDVEGCDISRDTCEFLKETFNLTVHPCAIEEMKATEQYNLIFSSHLIEHYYDPKVFMVAAKRLLSIPGYIWLYTPDLDRSNSCDPAWHHFQTRQPFEHLCVLSPRAMRYLAWRTGYDIIHIERHEKYDAFEAILYNLPAEAKKNLPSI